MWRGNVVPIHEKDDKLIVKNYRPVSLLLICSKVFERLIYNIIYDFLSDNKLLFSNQSGFRSGYSCINQLLAINSKVLNEFDKRFEVCEIFIYISKAFEKVWQNGLIFKLRQNGTGEDIINILRDFLCNRKQRVVLDSQCSSWADVCAVFLKDQSLDIFCS